jgi:alkylresorcinol/alkylpyrone synthase
MSSHILGLQSAVPPFVISQNDAAAYASKLFGEVADMSRMIPVFANTGIERRYSCVPIDWYLDDHGCLDRTELYISHDEEMQEQVTRKLLDQTGLRPDQLDGIVLVSTTGVATPSLDALLVERMQLRRDIQRLPIFGLGCAGGVIGLARASQLAKAQPGAKILYLAVELCALTFRKNDVSKSNIIATALFGDGAAGAILSTEGDGPEVGPVGEYTWPASLDIMGWDMAEAGLKARFAQSIPSLVAKDFRRLLDEFLARHNVPLNEIDAFACHPGGAKVLDALEDAMDMQRGDLKESRDVLKGFGNMSAVTVLFVAERMRLMGQKTLLTALGPGFTCAFLMLDGR